MSATRKSDASLDALVDSLVKIVSKYAPKSDAYKSVKELLDTTDSISKDYVSLSAASIALGEAQANATKAFGSKDMKAFAEALKVEYPLFGKFEKINESFASKGYDDISKLLQPIINKIPKELADIAQKFETAISGMKDSVTAMSGKIKSDHLLLMSAASKLSQMKKNMAAPNSQSSENTNKATSGPLFKPAPAATSHSTAQIVPAPKTMKSNGG